jgi:hypothetical protein
MIPKFIWAKPNKIDIFIFREFKKGSSERLPRQLGSTPNGYGSWYLTKPALYASLNRGTKVDYKKSDSCITKFLLKKEIPNRCTQIGI